MKLIDKDALEAEIERLYKKHSGKYGCDEVGLYLNVLKGVIDTIEVKEVYLEKETKKWWKEHLHLNPENKLWMDAHQSIVFAKHFFELGLHCSQTDDSYIDGVKGSYTTTDKD